MYSMLIILQAVYFTEICILRAQLRLVLTRCIFRRERERNLVVIWPYLKLRYIYCDVLIQSLYHILDGFQCHIGEGGNNKVCQPLRETFKNPNHGFVPWWGYPPRPLPPSRQAAGQKINGKKITAKGGTPPPITASGLEFFRQKRRFLPKKHCFWANFQQIF